MQTISSQKRRLSASQHEGLAAFLEFFEAGFGEVARELGFGQGVSFEPLKSRLLAQPEVYFPAQDTQSPAAQLLARVRELPRS